MEFLYLNASVLRFFAHCTLVFAAIDISAGAAEISKANKSLELIDYDVRLQTILEHDDGVYLWFHPRAVPIETDQGSVMLTLQKHLRRSDHYSDLHFMLSDNLGDTWTRPRIPPELRARHEASGVTVTVADVTPGWHVPSQRVLVVGAQVRYDSQGNQLEDVPRAHQTAYAIYDPSIGTWTPWKVLDMPKGDMFNYAYSACAQWLVQADGDVLLPYYFGKSAAGPHEVSVVECSFDGERLTYLRHGTVFKEPSRRGLCEPSLVRCDGKYYLTMRHDLGGYVAVSNNGLDYMAKKPWRFDDGNDLGSYNTQQHWLTHENGLFLVYTRRGADNGHVIRHRAPLFIGQVDPLNLRVVRKTERVLIPERGAALGNFGANRIDQKSSWVTVSEGVWSADARKRGAKGATFIAKIYWKTSKSKTAGGHRAL